jgi:AraC family cel operon transcriptional repressor
MARGNHLDGGKERVAPIFVLGTMPHIRLFHSDVLAHGESVHLTRAGLAQGRSPSLHDHDFYELIRVTGGHARHHLSGGTQDLSEGDLVFVRPHDAHALQGRGGAATVVVVAFHPDLIARMIARHPSLEGRLFWSRADEPVHIPAALAHREGVDDLIDKLDKSPRDALAAEAFLLPLCSALGNDGPAGLPAMPPGAPGWLVAACIAARDPIIFREGAAGFARVAGRAHPHVSRTVRKFLDQSPSDYVNGQRMAHAARLLSGSSESIADIAADCGIPNLSHFHKLFREHHGTTPLQYRKARQKDLVQPG